MARYEDYVSEDIDGEIKDAAAQQRARDDKGRFIPERFQGKDITDVIKSYEELEKLNSRQAQDLGEMRRTVDQLLEIQTASSPAEEPSKPLTVDDIYENPDDVIRRVAREESSSEIKELRDEVSRLRTEKVMDGLESKYPNWLEVSNSPEFSQWVQQSPYRVRVAQDAAGGDFDAADEILGMYYESEVKAEDNAQAEQTRQQSNLEDAMLESGGPAPANTGDYYSRSELMELRIAAKSGDLKADRWLKAHAEAIAQAYAEDRIVD